MHASNNDNMLIYQSADGKIKIDVRFEKETVWLTLDQMATLFGRDKSTISRHIKNVFEERELSLEATVANFATAYFVLFCKLIFLYIVFMFTL